MNLENFPENKIAKKMLNTVTQGWYDRSYVGKWLFEVMGREMEDARTLIEELPLQAYPETATWGLMYHEILYGLPVNIDLSLEERRKAVIKKRNMRAPLNPDKLEEWIYLTTGVRVHIAENVKPYTFCVRFENLDFSYALSDLFREIRNVKPSHLSFMWGLGLTVENRNEVLLSKIRIKFNVPWAVGGYYLDGSFLLDGSVILTLPDLNPFNMRIRCDHRLREEFLTSIVSYKNYWVLDGTYRLNGERQLNAERIEEVI